MNNSSSGKGLERFFAGKGFYIVLFLCAAVIGVSAWMMAAGDRTMAEDISRVNQNSLENKRVETVIIPARETEPVIAAQEETVEAAAIETEAPAAETANEVLEESSQVWRQGDTMEVAAPMYVWPVSGELERRHDLENLSYDVTMRDWRTHAGIDILAPLGETVAAAHAGTVASIAQDDLYGTVVTVDHGDGTKTVYANLADVPAVAVGDWVEPGTVIGAIGTTALCEIGQGTHLHFAVTVDGKSANPLDFLPA